ncbi:hypothetical protein [Vibrio sp. Vb0877]|uniref:hypothetical protein n=1 Tax=Vibrio sp. Vb0877 TaxID=2816073 RepID=UPI001F5D6ECA|nr:hypothetical protein [Vibrio sp. Vb0877]
MNTIQPTSDRFDDQVIIPSMKNSILNSQMDLFGGQENLIALEPAMPGVYFDAPEIDLDYDIAIVCMSGGKDSFAALKYLLDRGFPPSKIELWHHLVDGNEGSTLMDWAFIDDYCVKLSKAIGIPLYFSWLKHGFEGEMLKNSSKSHEHIVETPDGLIQLPRNGVKVGTRLKFPQQAASLQTRWCSSALKIDVGRRGITSQDRFVGKRVLFITGERRKSLATAQSIISLNLMLVIPYVSPRIHVNLAILMPGGQFSTLGKKKCGKFWQIGSWCRQYHIV